MANLLSMLFGCWHNHCSFPITAKRMSGGRRPLAAQATGTYIVCLDCGKEFPYDWNEMRILSPSAQKRWARSHSMEPGDSFATPNGRAA